MVPVLPASMTLSNILFLAWQDRPREMRSAAAGYSLSQLLMSAFLSSPPAVPSAP